MRVQDEFFSSLSKDDRNYIINKILEDVKGRMLEDIITLEFNKAKRKAFKLNCFQDGDIDMIVEKEEGVELYEIKHSDKVDPKQIRHILDPKKCEYVEHRFGKILGRFVLYRGEEKEVNGIQYLNIEDTLCRLGKT